ncbi:MAG: rRNA pseudouridine synthase, partial [Roseiflexaceae bacterium]|nr:rRNA pseudouridine synthase [Roseiflexaceae bacterium]
MSAERLQKVLAAAGIASRRDCEVLIEAGRVTINGKVTNTLGARVDPDTDEILVDGAPIRKAEARTYVMLNKPTGVISTSEDTHNRPTVVEQVGSKARLFPVGRLDQDSEGLILLTDDGALTQRLTHPSFNVEKEYRALLDRAPDADALREWRDGVELDGEITAPAWIDTKETTDDGVWVRIVLQEGRKRQIREVARLLGYEVRRLIRVREGSLMLGDLPIGTSRNLTDEEVETIWKHVGGRPSEDGFAQEDENSPRRRRSISTLGAVATSRGGRDQTERPQRDDRPRRDDNRPSSFGDRPQRDDRPRDDRPRPGGYGQRDDRPRPGGYSQRPDRPSSG